MTGGRIKRIEKYVDNEPFFMTYGDAVCDVDINKLLEFHKKHGKRSQEKHRTGFVPFVLSILAFLI